MTVVLTFQICKTQDTYKRPKMHFPESSEHNINYLISAYLNSSHVYLTMTAIMNNQNWEFPGLKAFLKNQCNEKKDMVTKLMDYQHMRNGEIIILTIKKVHVRDIGEPLIMMNYIYKMERDIKNILRHMHREAWREDDFEFSHLLVSYMENQTKILSKIGKIMYHLKKKNADDFTCPYAQEMMC